MFENFRSARYHGTIITGPWTPLLPGLFSADTLCECPTRRFSRDTGRVFLWLYGGVIISGNNFVCVTTVRTVADPCPQNFLSVIVVRGKASYCKTRPAPLINRFFYRLWRSSHM
jgi:hypothetical protein